MKAALRDVDLVTDAASRNAKTPPPVQPAAQHFVSFEVTGADGDALDGGFRVTQNDMEMLAGPRSDGARVRGLTSSTTKLHLTLENDGGPS